LPACFAVPGNHPPSIGINLQARKRAVCGKLPFQRRKHPDDPLRRATEFDPDREYKSREMARKRLEAIRHTKEMPTSEDVMDKLRLCYDPEIPLNIVDLGLIYNVNVNEGEVEVEMTLTAEIGRTRLPVRQLLDLHAGDSLVWSLDAEGRLVVSGGRQNTLEDIRAAVAAAEKTERKSKMPARVTIEDMKAGIARAIRSKHGRR